MNKPPRILLFIILSLCIGFSESLKSPTETLIVMPHVSGLRVENMLEQPGFNGYSEAWETIVEPEVEVMVIIFGYWLDEVERISFTDQVCINSEFNVTSDMFTNQTQVLISFPFKFPLWDSPWRMCIKQKGPFGELFQIDDDRTWIRTNYEKMEESMLPLPVQILIVSFLLCLSALFSGLTIGLMSLSTQELMLIINSGSPSDASYAKAILPVRRKGNYLLCTILIMNVIVNAAISILFENLASGFVAFVTSSIGIVIFGEIVPQSICIKYGLAIGGTTIWLTKFFMFITFPLAYPISKLLDVLLGEEVDQFDRNRLVELIKMSTEDENMEFAEDLKIAVGAMEFAKKSAKDVMTMIDDVYMLEENEVLNTNTIADIVKRGYTRIPIYADNDRNQVTSLLFVNDLALVDTKNNMTIKAITNYHNRQLRFVEDDISLAELLEEFKRGSYHLAMVVKSSKKPTIFVESQIEHFVKATVPLMQTVTSDTYFKESDSNEIIGLITLEDIIEEILQSEIVDESDSVLDNVQRSKRKITQSQLEDLFCCESRSEPLSINMLEVVSDWLAKKSSIFDDSHMNAKAREKMIQRNIKQGTLLSKRSDGTRKVVYLYEHYISSKRMILILEGKAKVYYKNTNMTFEVGPWTFFGEALLEKLVETMEHRKELHSGLYFSPDFEVTVDQPCRFLQISVTSLLHALRISQLVRHIRTPSQSTQDLSSDVQQMFLGVPNNTRGRNLSTAAFGESSTYSTRSRSMSSTPFPTYKLETLQ